MFMCIPSSIQFLHYGVIETQYPKPKTIEAEYTYRLTTFLSLIRNRKERKAGHLGAPHIKPRSDHYLGFSYASDRYASQMNTIIPATPAKAASAGLPLMTPAPVNVDGTGDVPVGRRNVELLPVGVTVMFG